MQPGGVGRAEHSEEVSQALGSNGFSTTYKLDDIEEITLSEAQLFQTVKW